MPQSAARQGVDSRPVGFEEWWVRNGVYYYQGPDSKPLAQAAWLAAIRYAEFNIGLDKR